MCKVKVWVFPDSMISAVTLPLEVLATANRLWRLKHGAGTPPLFTWKVETLTGEDTTTPSGLRLQADGRISVASDDDVLLLPSLITESDPGQFWHSLTAVQHLRPLLQKAHAQGTCIAANGGMTFMLADAGLLDGGMATGGRLEHMFRRHYPNVDYRIDEPITEFNGVYCTATAEAFARFALNQVQRLAGTAIAAECARALLVDVEKMPLLGANPLSVTPPQTHGDRLVLRAQEWIHGNSRQPFNLQALADHLCVSPRTVIRRFNHALGTTPGSYAYVLKVDIAKRLLVDSTMSVEQIGERVGYTEYRSFSLLFKRRAGLSPVAYRKQHGGAALVPKKARAEPRMLPAANSLSGILELDLFGRGARQQLALSQAGDGLAVPC